MNETETALLLFFVLFTLFLFWRTWDMSGLPSFEITDIHEEFRGSENFLRPLVLAASSPSRSILRVSVLLSVNTVLITPIFFIFQWPERVWMLGGLVFLEIAIVYFVTAENKKKYRCDLEECRLFTHPGVKRLVGSIEDRPEPPYKGNHLVSGGRILSVVLSTTGAEERAKLFFPIHFYGQRQVEETTDAVVVFYQSWREAGLVPKADHESLLGVYVGFRQNPDSLLQESSLAAKSMLQARPTRG